jgi:hypothetical protein
MDTDPAAAGKLAEPGAPGCLAEMRTLIFGCPGLEQDGPSGRCNPAARSGCSRKPVIAEVDNGFR